MGQPDRSRTFASRVLASVAQLREKVLGSRDFQEWLKSHKDVIVDGQRYFLVGGDMLRDEDEMILTWSRRQGLIDQATIDRLHSEESSDYEP
jgi:hypothetical protein